MCREEDAGFQAGLVGLVVWCAACVGQCPVCSRCGERSRKHAAKGIILTLLWGKSPSASPLLRPVWSSTDEARRERRRKGGKKVPGLVRHQADMRSRPW